MEKQNSASMSKKAGSIEGQTIEMIGLREIWRHIKVHKFLIGILVVSAINITALTTFFGTPEYTASVVISVAPTNSFKTMSDITGFYAGAEILLNKMSAITEYFNSPELSEYILTSLAKNEDKTPVFGHSGSGRILTNLGLKKPLTVTQALQTRPRAQLASEIMSHLKIIPNITNSTMTIQSTAASPEMAAFFANESSKALLEINHKVALKMIVEVKQFLNSQSTELGNKLKALESQLTEFQSNNKIITVGEAERSVYLALDNNHHNLTEKQMQLAENEKTIRAIQNEMKIFKENIANPTQNGSNLYLTQLQHRLYMLQYQEAMAGSNTPEGKRIQDELTQVAKSYQSAFESRNKIQDMSSMLTPLEYYQKLEQSLADLERDHKKLESDKQVLMAEIDRWQGKIPKLASTTQKLAEIHRNIQLTSELYLAIGKKMQETQIQEASAVNDISILSEAAIPASPKSTSLPLKIIFSAVLGLFGGVFYILLKEALLPTVRNRHDLERRGLVILGEVPALTQKQPQTKDNAVILLRDQPGSYEADVYRSIRMKLVSSDTKEGAKVIMMTSPRGGNGKTFTAVNLAMTLAKGQYKTLLIDLDLRHPSVRDYFKNVKWNGSIDELAKNGFDPKKQDLVTEVDNNLSIVFGNGKVPNAAEILDSNIISEFIQSKKEKYEFIIIDLPPVLGVIDALMVAPIVDMVLFVLEHRRTYRSDVDLAIDILEEVHHKPIWAVINFVHREYTYYDTLRYYEYRKKNRNITNSVA